MASYASIAVASKSIERLINACFADDPPIDGYTSRATLVRTEDLVKTGTAFSFPIPGLTLFFYRVDFNKTMRAAWSAVGSIDGRGHLPLDLHFLVTPWADNAEHEQRVLGKAMECLETTPIITGPILFPDPTAQWAPNDAIQIVLEEISTEAVMRTFDSLPIDYKLSVPYIARVVRVDSKRVFASPPVEEVVRKLTPAMP
jgi:hypothetical protein